MSNPKALVLRTGGTNCDAETLRALEVGGARPELLHLDRLVAEPQRLEDARIVVFPGGFSFGDDIAAGRVFGFEVRARLAEPLARFVEQSGYVLGICNGFQVLVDTNLLDPPEPGEQRAAPRDISLAWNHSGRFECRWVTLEGQRSACAWIEPGELLPCPVAHAEGRLVLRDDVTLARLERRGQIALRYVDARGGRRDGPVEYPANPNGSAGDIAGLCDPSGRVLGLMPHPERNLAPWNHPQWTRLAARGEGEGARFFRRLVEAAGEDVAAVASRG